MGHTWIPTFMSVFTKNFQPFRETLLNLTFNDPNITYIKSVNGGPSGMQGLAYALSALQAEKTDRYRVWNCPPPTTKEKKALSV
ncbi:hypothetical protein DPMN_047183 [Dreissena polymorpha]|uniref:Uncharacterized protein n=1 Tax=Dreissena polymorpha TaxID=45954 RepID=A0A9D4D892_DREPO|nr:hypothetical protein DPMN_047183 [Dreissena polymorpha]